MSARLRRKDGLWGGGAALDDRSLGHVAQAWGLVADLANLLGNGVKPAMNILALGIVAIATQCADHTQLAGLAGRHRFEPLLQIPKRPRSVPHRAFIDLCGTVLAPGAADTCGPAKANKAVHLIGVMAGVWT